MFDAVNSIERATGPTWFSCPPLRQPRRRRRQRRRPVWSWRASFRKPRTRSEAPPLAAYLATIPDGDGKIGRGQARQRGRREDSRRRARTTARDAPDAYRPKTKPGVYVPTPITVGVAWPNVTPFAHDQPVAIPAAAADRARQRAMGRRLQRDQGSRQQGQQQALGPADRGCPLLADRRTAELPIPSRASWWPPRR